MKLTNSILILTVAGLVLSFSAQAEVKGGERLIQNSVPVVAAPNDYKPMACATCKDVTVTVANANAKGASLLAGTAVKTVAKHSCGGCYSVATAGGGKHAPYSVAHKCTANASQTCCNSVN